MQRDYDNCATSRPVVPCRQGLPCLRDSPQEMGALRIAVVGAAVALATCLTASDGAAQQASGPKPGGTYRVAFESAFGFTDGFDPTGEYYTFSWNIESN